MLSDVWLRNHEHYAGQTEKCVDKAALNPQHIR